MMLNEDKITLKVPLKKGRKPREEDIITTKGERTKATEFLNSFTAIKTKLLKATVFLSSTYGFGSGVILGVDGTKAYVLTAKHNLFIFANEKSPSKKPSEYELSGYGSGGITIRYEPEKLLEDPLKPVNPSKVQVSGISFGGVEGSGDDWSYDAILLECEDTNFYTFVNTNRFINRANYQQYINLLGPSGVKYKLLNRKHYQYIQLGYGSPRGEKLSVGDNVYKGYERRIQCKQSVPTADTPSPVTLYEPILSKERSKWRSFVHAVELNAGITKSTAPGDSGGPLFSISQSNENEFYLLGVTSGANFYDDESKLAEPPRDDDIHNNIATYWYEIFLNCPFLNR